MNLRLTDLHEVKGADIFKKDERGLVSLLGKHTYRFVLSQRMSIFMHRVKPKVLQRFSDHGDRIYFQISTAHRIFLDNQIEAKVQILNSGHRCFIIPVSCAL